MCQKLRWDFLAVIMKHLNTDMKKTTFSVHVVHMGAAKVLSEYVQLRCWIIKVNFLSIIDAIAQYKLWHEMDLSFFVCGNVKGVSTRYILISSKFCSLSLVQYWRQQITTEHVTGSLFWGFARQRKMSNGCCFTLEAWCFPVNMYWLTFRSIHLNAIIILVSYGPMFKLESKVQVPAPIAVFTYGRQDTSNRSKVSHQASIYLYESVTFWFVLHGLFGS